MLIVSIMLITMSMMAAMMTLMMKAAMTITCILRWVPSVGQSAIINAKRPNCSWCCSTTNNIQSKRTTNILPLNQKYQYSTINNFQRKRTIKILPQNFNEKYQQQISNQKNHRKYRKKTSPKVPPKTLQVKKPQQGHHKNQLDCFASNILSKVPTVPPTTFKTKEPSKLWKWII